MPRIFFQYAGQVVAYALFAGFVGYFAASPAYVHLDPSKASIKLSFSHATDPVSECRRLSQEELNQLPPNMRRPTDCPRQRLPLLVELELDGKLLYSDTLSPSGLAGDGPATVYKKFAVVAGQHQLIARLRDSARRQGFDHEQSMTISLTPQQNLVVDFRPALGGFLFL